MRVVVILISCLMIVSCRAEREVKPAAFSLPSRGSSLLTVAIEREHTHLFLAEYDRYLILSVDGSEKQRIKAFEDTGGYSRTDVFQIADSQYILRGFHDRYELDTEKQSISPIESFDTTRAKFRGCFDTDENHIWRFISASERSQLPMKDYLD